MAINAKMMKRIVFGLAMIALLGGLLAWDASLDTGNMRGLPVAGLTAILVIAGFFEYASMAEKVAMPCMALTGGLCAIAVATLPVWSLARSFEFSVGGLLAGSAALCFIVQMARYRLDSAIRRLAATFFGIIYLGVLASFILAIRIRFDIATLLSFLIVVKATDIGAYFTGSLIGKHKIIPWLSPGKSWEGLIGGIISSVAASCLLATLLLENISLLQAAAFGVIMTLVGQFGDLCESLLKRDSGVKDSACIIPEFGGVLDLVDSPLIAAPAAYMLLAFL